MLGMIFFGITIQMILKKFMSGGEAGITKVCRNQINPYL
jgi:hypothetical protein